MVAAWCLVGVLAEPGTSVLNELFWCNTLCVCRAKTQVEVQCFDRKQLYNLLGFSEKMVRRLERNNWEMETQVHWCNDLCLCHTKNNREFQCVQEHSLVQFITETVGDRYFLYTEEPEDQIKAVEEVQPVGEEGPVKQPAEEGNLAEEEGPVERPVEEENPVEQPVEKESSREEEPQVEEEISIEKEKPEQEESPVEDEYPVEEEHPLESEQTVEEGQPLEDERPVEEEVSDEKEEIEKIEHAKRSERRKNKKTRKPKKIHRKKDHNPPVEEDVAVSPTAGAVPEPTTEHVSAPDPTMPLPTTTPSQPAHISAHQNQPLIEEEAELLPKQEAVAASPAVTAMQPPTRRQPFPTLATATTAPPHTQHATTYEEDPVIPPKVSPVLEVPMERKTVATEVSQDLEELSDAVMQIKSDVVLNQRILLVTVAVAGIAMLGVLIVAVHGCSRRRHNSSDSKKKRDANKDDNHVAKVNLEEAW